MKKTITKLFTSLIRDKNKRRSVRATLLQKNNAPAKCVDFANKSTYLSETVHYNQEAFLEYKNKFAGKDVVVIGSGPTLNDYTPIKNAIHIGSNRAHLNKKLKLDFLFRQDFKDFDKEIFDCHIKKFIGNYYNWQADMCPESVFNRLTNAQKFIIDTDTQQLQPDIANMPLWHGGSVAFSMFQFALWTNPKRIYIVGCDSAGQKDALHWNHFDDKTKETHNQEPITALVVGWSKLAEFAKAMYPDVEIISINPVGLKGLFKDEYRKKGEK